ncbi:MAG: PAS domain S-box protein [Bacteroidota bacterium]
MNKKLSVLIIEDNETDAYLNIRQLQKEGYEVISTLVETKNQFCDALKKQTWDVILADYSLPVFDAPTALETLHETGLDIPFIVISGVMGEDRAVEMMKAGTHDYFMKNKLALLGSAIERELREAESRKERKRTEQALFQSQRDLQLLFDSIDDFLFITKTSGIILQTNLVLETRLGYSAEELRQMNIMDLLVTEAVISSGGDSLSLNIKYLDAPLRKKDGTLITAETKITHGVWGNEAVLIAITRDLTEWKNSEMARQKSEIQYRNIFENANDAIFLISENRFIECNQKSVEMYGCENKQDLLNRYPWEFSPQFQPDGTNSIPQASRFLSLAYSGSPQRFYWKHFRKNGSEFDCEVSLNSVEFEGATVVQAIVRDISDRIRAEEILKESKEQLKVFAAHLQTVREDERILIARELHDNLGQNLTGLRMDISRIIKKLNKLEMREEIQSVMTLSKEMIPIIDATIEQVRKISSDLRPRVLDELGLISAIEWQIEQFSERSGIDCTLVNNIDSIDIEKKHKTGIFRIFQEALTNIVRHAKATIVEVNIYQIDGWVMFEITDNGIGINDAKLEDRNSLGLLGMRERAILFGGILEITGRIGEGTKVLLKIPIQQ